MLVKHNPFETHPAVVGHSAQWNDALERAARLAGTATTALITCECPFSCAPAKRTTS
jgi:hypothetical protein